MQEVAVKEHMWSDVVYQVLCVTRRVVSVIREQFVPFGFAFDV